MSGVQDWQLRVAIGYLEIFSNAKGFIWKLLTYIHISRDIIKLGLARLKNDSIDLKTDDTF